MDPQLEAFLALAADDVELQQLLTDRDADVVALAEARGIALDHTRLKVHRQAWQEQQKTMLLSDNQLEAVAGGAAGAAEEVICIDITCRHTVWWYVGFFGTANRNITLPSNGQRTWSGRQNRLQTFALPMAVGTNFHQDSLFMPGSRMPEEQLKAFLLYLSQNKERLERLKASSDLENLTALAQEAGINLSADEGLRCQNEYLSDEDPEIFTGGGSMNPMTQPPPTPGPTQWIDIGNGTYIDKRC